MSKIDTTRLSTVLAALAKPKERVGSTLTNGASPGKTSKGASDVEVLRSRLQNRLLSLKRQSSGFDEAAPTITVQEILRWEFGEQILEHPEFGRIAEKVTKTMLENQQLEKKIQNVIDEMSK
ncbi:hypothetical protein HX882_07695 [Pseudomonas gingeri]|uniref:Uncharacterized protein n=1 Tax=Pseudomonas gingeri TaxID=117681 RepID=A0A7Y7XA04_9PSED|nr:hypothetical protein [Pseudomonas gingeri]NWB95766.1 hypothetical protein [Pseudomonas gingeri]